MSGAVQDVAKLKFDPDGLRKGGLPPTWQRMEDAGKQEIRERESLRVQLESGGVSSIANVQHASDFMGKMEVVAERNKDGVVTYGELKETGKITQEIYAPSADGKVSFDEVNGRIDQMATPGIFTGAKLTPEDKTILVEGAQANFDGKAERIVPPVIPAMPDTIEGVKVPNDMVVLVKGRESGALDDLVGDVATHISEKAYAGLAASSAPAAEATPPLSGAENNVPIGQGTSAAPANPSGAKTENFSAMLNGVCLKGLGGCKDVSPAGDVNFVPPSTPNAPARSAENHK